MDLQRFKNDLQLLTNDLERFRNNFVTIKKRLCNDIRTTLQRFRNDFATISKRLYSNLETTLQRYGIIKTCLHTEFITIWDIFLISGCDYKDLGYSLMSVLDIVIQSFTIGHVHQMGWKRFDLFGLTR